MGNQPPKVFISHSSKDEDVVEDFVTHILNIGLDLGRENIFCSSIDDCGIKTGEEFRQEIQKHLATSDCAILMITENYRESEICLNEMGATWALNIPVFPLILRPVTFEIVGVLLETRQICELTSERGLDRFAQDVTDTCNLGNKKITTWNSARRNFLRSISNNQVAAKQTRKKEKPDFEFFNQFLEPNVDIYRLILQCQPTILDCQTLYWKTLYIDAFKFHSHQFTELTKSSSEHLDSSLKHYRLVSTDSGDYLGNWGPKANGKLRLSIFNSGITLYDLVFTKFQTETSGRSFRAFAFINNRWICIPEPQKSNEAILDWKSIERKIQSNS